MKRTPKLNSQVVEEATAWFIDFNEGEVDQAGREEFNAWLRRSPEHVRAFLQASAFWEDAGALGKTRPDLDELIARAKAEQNVYPLELAAREPGQSSATEAGSRRVARRWFAAAACVAVTLVGATNWYVLGWAPTYVTEVGEQRSFTLEDGSTVELNSRSRLKVHYTQDERSVELLEGQALFSVAKNPARPFVVTTGDTRVRAVGTQFDVYRKHAGTVVTVVEGRVAVVPTPTVRDRAVPAKPDEILLAAGEQMMITPVEVTPPQPVDLSVATAWTDRKLVFESTPLHEVVEEFNRYNRQQLVIRDPALDDLHVSGVFPSTDSSRMVEFLRQRFGVTMNRSRDEIEISGREPGRTEEP
jgi:transmembrane sensor